jgi:GTP cyclohydrolase II
VKLLENNPELYEAFSKKAIFNVRERFSIQKEINAYKDLYLMMCNQLS